MFTDFPTQIASTIGKWHKSFFTNGDVIDLLNAMAISQSISDPRDHLYTIIKSRFPDCTMQKYKIYKKALAAKMKVEPRKSRRSISSSCIKLPGNKCALPIRCFQLITTVMHVMLLTWQKTMFHSAGNCSKCQRKRSRYNYFCW